jgi:hypothetical protein
MKKMGESIMKLYFPLMMRTSHGHILNPAGTIVTSMVLPDIYCDITLAPYVPDMKLNVYEDKATIEIDFKHHLLVMGESDDKGLITHNRCE